VKAAFSLTVNGRGYDVEAEPRKTLADVLREECGLTGTHLGCEHGVCGTCTILIDGAPARACLMFGIQGAGKAIRTVEGLAGADGLHLLQRKFIEHHGLQCGFCTPGFLMLGVAILERERPPDDAELIDLLSSNLCRCTGYAGILAAMKAALAEKGSP